MRENRDLILLLGVSGMCPALQQTYPSSSFVCFPARPGLTGTFRGCPPCRMDAIAHQAKEHPSALANLSLHAQNPESSRVGNLEVSRVRLQPWKASQV